MKRLYQMINVQLMRWSGVGFMEDKLVVINTLLIGYPMGLFSSLWVVLIQDKEKDVTLF